MPNIHDVVEVAERLERMGEHSHAARQAIIDAAGGDWKLLQDAAEFVRDGTPSYNHGLVVARLSNAAKAALEATRR